MMRTPLRTTTVATLTGETRVTRGGGRRAWLVLLLVLGGVTACEKVSHQTIEEWRTTQKGPGKLAQALADSSLEPDVRAHAAQALISIERLTDVQGALTNMKEPERAAVVEKLAPRLWHDAKLSDDLQVPSSRQVLAKDALFTVREWARGPVRDATDRALVEWLAGFYEGRSGLGVYHGDRIVRAIGQPAAERLIAVAQTIAKDPGDGKKIPVVADELLMGIAASGAPDAVGFLLDLATRVGRGPRGHADAETDPTLAPRALSALLVTYLSVPAVDPGGLRRQLTRLEAIAAGSSQPGELVNAAFDLIAAAGDPPCLEPLARLARHKDEVRRWQAVQHGLTCAGVDAVVPMANALPDGLLIPQGIAAKYFWDKIIALGPRAAVPARALLEAPTWFARATGIAVLGQLGGAEDVARLRRMAADRTIALTVARHDAASRTTLGELAGEAANLLEKGKGPGVK